MEVGSREEPTATEGGWYDSATALLHVSATIRLAWGLRAGLLAILHRANSHNAAEYRSESATALVADHSGDFGEGQVCLPQETLGLFYPQVSQELNRRHAGLSGEYTGEVECTVQCGTRKIIHPHATL